MKKVLIVSPNWPPVSFPDMHRARTALPCLAENGWTALVLTVNPDEQVGPRDPMLERTVPEGTRVWRSGCIPKAWTAWFGLRHVGLRSLFHLARLGSRVIEEEKPDIAFFSTTMFPLFILGPWWLRRHGLRYVLDFQDPWVSDYRGERARGWKARVSRALARWLEPRCVRGASAIVSVSPGYLAALESRYGRLRVRTRVLPFGAPEHDFEILPSLGAAAPAGGRTWLYAGRGGPDMAFALRGFFLALAAARTRSPAEYADLQVRFVGTDYEPGERARKTVEPIANECGVGDMVVEQPGRIPYFDALRDMAQAEALIVPGSDDPGYSASKIFPCILSRRPLLAVFHERSPVVEVVRSTGAGTVVTFDGTERPEELADRIGSAWFDAPPCAPATDWSAFSRHTARAMTRELCATFDAAFHGDA